VRKRPDPDPADRLRHFIKQTAGERGHALALGDLVAAGRRWPAWRGPGRVGHRRPRLCVGYCGGGLGGVHSGFMTAMTRALGALPGGPPGVWP
jgi:hypothetical protein